MLVFKTRHSDILHTSVAIVGTVCWSSKHDIRISFILQSPSSELYAGLQNTTFGYPSYFSRHRRNCILIFKTRHSDILHTSVAIVGTVCWSSKHDIRISFILQSLSSELYAGLQNTTFGYPRRLDCVTLLVTTIGVSTYILTNQSVNTFTVQWSINIMYTHIGRWILHVLLVCTT